MLRWLRNILWAVAIGLLLFLAYVAASSDRLDTLWTVLATGGCLVALAATAVLFHQSDRAARQRRGMVVLVYLEQAVRMNLPLPRMLAAAAASEPPTAARRLRRLRQRLESGAGVAEALGAAVPEASRRSRGLIAAGERVGRLPDALARLVAEDRERLAEDPGDQAFLAAYPLAMTLVILLVIGLISLFVLPKFQQILHDFHTPIPAVTHWLIAITTLSSGSVLGNGLFLLAWCVAPLAVILGPRWLPVGPVFTRHRDLADACRVVGDELGAGVGLDRAVRDAAGLSIHRRLRGRLARWADGMTAGVGATDAARAAGMPPLVVGLVATGEVTAAVETFAFLARYYENQFSRLAQLARGAAVPALVFCFGAIVALVALALFLPLVALIDAASRYQVSP